MSEPDGNAVTREFLWKFFRMLGKVEEYNLVQCVICRKRMALTGGQANNKILSIHMLQSHRERMPKNYRLTLIERDTMPVKGPKVKRSYVWHYFDRLGDTAKCRVCQYEIKNKNGNTSSLIRHLEQVHRLKKGTMVNDFKNLPTMPRQSSNMGSCMRDRVFRSFEEGDKGIWRCKFCSYALGTRKLLTMFHHLKSVHWKANGPAYNEFIMENRVLAGARMIEEVNEGLASTSAVDESVVVLSCSENVAGKMAASESGQEREDQMETYILDDELIAKLSQDISSRSPEKDIVAADNSVDENALQTRNISVGETIADGKNYELKICSLADGNEIGCLVFSNAEEIDQIDQGQSAVNLDHNYHDESRTVSPVVVDQDVDVDAKATGGQLSRNDRNEESQDDVEPQVPIGNERKFDHQYSRRSNLKAAVVRQGKGSKVVSNESIVMVKSKNDIGHVQDLPVLRDSHSPKLESDNDDPIDFDPQVPLQNVQNLTNEIKRENNGPASNYEFIKIEKAGARQNVGVIILNRPKTLNAICDKLMRELADAVEKYDSDQTVGALVITGNEKAFAAGPGRKMWRLYLNKGEDHVEKGQVLRTPTDLYLWYASGTDIEETMSYTFSQTFKSSFLSHWTAVTRATKPIIAAVNGYALGGGCELAMMCDIVYAGEQARFGQPDVVLGHVPSQGGTQRLARIIGKSKTMEMILTGSQITAQDAERMGLVSKVFPADRLLAEAIKLGEKISSNSQLIVAMAKEAVNAAYETTLQEGLHFERRLSYATFATADLKEGMNAFVEKRAPKFSNQ